MRLMQYVLIKLAGVRGLLRASLPSGSLRDVHLLPVNELNHRPLSPER